VKFALLTGFHRVETEVFGVEKTSPEPRECAGVAAVAENEASRTVGDR